MIQDNKTLNDLVLFLETSYDEKLWTYDSKYWQYDEKVFMMFYEKYGDVHFMDIPDVPFLFMELSNWQGMSLRCGVWQYYESGAFEKGKLERVSNLLHAEKEDEMATIYKSGIHDYSNEKYRENYDYPEEWIAGSDQIDKWISDNEKHIYMLRYNLILENKAEILKFIEN